MRIRTVGRGSVGRYSSVNGPIRVESAEVKSLLLKGCGLSRSHAPSTCFSRTATASRCYLAMEDSDCLWELTYLEAYPGEGYVMYFLAPS